MHKMRGCYNSSFLLHKNYDSRETIPEVIRMTKKQEKKNQEHNVKKEGVDAKRRQM